MVQPLVSIIIPAHNAEKYLAEAIESILQQDYLNYEIWVLDNGSTDNTRRIAKSFPQVNYVYNKKADAALARNQGVTLARGEYIAFLDQDDTWVSNKLSKQVDLLQAQQQYGAVIGLQQIYLQFGCEKPHWLKADFLEKPQLAYLPSALMVKRSVFDVTNNFDLTFSMASDVAWFFKAKHQGVLIATIDEVLIHRRIHNENASSQFSALHHEILTVIKTSLKERREVSQNV